MNCGFSADASSRALEKRILDTCLMKRVDNSSAVPEASLLPVTVFCVVVIGALIFLNFAVSFNRSPPGSFATSANGATETQRPPERWPKPVAPIH